MPYKLMRLANTDKTGSVQSSITVENDCDELNLQEMLSMYEDFLKGCGFVFEGNLTVVSEDRTDHMFEDEGWDTKILEDKEKSHENE